MTEPTGKKPWGTYMFLGLLVLIFTAGLLYILVPIHKPQEPMEPVFGGWIYSQEDQKTASAALAKAGLGVWRWNEGKLLVLQREKTKYESVLADNRAFPKAPSDARREALRDMSQFESAAKTRLRDLYSAAWQLEQTICQFSTQVGYATVGVRSRQEQMGLIQKNIVTASIGVWPREEEQLSPELLTSITLAAKHQLGISDNENISILDLRHGRSWLGSSEAISGTLAQDDKERQERYWTEKLQKALGHISGIRISTTVMAQTENDPDSDDAIASTQPIVAKNSACLGNRFSSSFISCYPSPRYAGTNENDRNANANQSDKTPVHYLPIAVHIALPAHSLQSQNATGDAKQSANQQQEAAWLQEIQNQAATILLPAFRDSNRQKKNTDEVAKLIHISVFNDTSASNVSLTNSRKTQRPVTNELPDASLSVNRNHSVEPPSQEVQVPSPFPVVTSKGNSESLSLESKGPDTNSCSSYIAAVQSFWEKNRGNSKMWSGTALVTFFIGWLVRIVIRKRKKAASRISKSDTDENTVEEGRHLRFDRVHDLVETGGPAPHTAQWDSLQEEVRDMVANHPDKAAQIIQRWIRTGA